MDGIIDLSASGGGGGIVTVADWDSLPSSPADLDLAVTEDDGLCWQWREVSGDGQWLPAAVVLDATVAYREDVDAELCRLRLGDAAWPATWLDVGATKAAGDPLAIEGGAGSKYLAAELPLSTGGLYLLVVIPTALGTGEAWLAYLAGAAGASVLLPGAYVTPSAAVVGSLSGVLTTFGGDSPPVAGRPIFLLHDDRAAARMTTVIVPGAGVWRFSSGPRSEVSTNATGYFGVTNLSATALEIDYIGAFEIT
jgi:hypothetical protein